jgi:hypothetical protein
VRIGSIPKISSPHETDRREGAGAPASHQCPASDRLHRMQEQRDVAVADFDSRHLGRSTSSETSRPYRGWRSTGCSQLHTWAWRLIMITVLLELDYLRVLAAQPTRCSASCALRMREFYRLQSTRALDVPATYTRDSEERRCRNAADQRRSSRRLAAMVRGGGRRRRMALGSRSETLRFSWERCLSKRFRSHHALRSSNMATVFSPPALLEL